MVKVSGTAGRISWLRDEAIVKTIDVVEYNGDARVDREKESSYTQRQIGMAIPPASYAQQGHHTPARDASKKGKCDWWAYILG